MKPRYINTADDLRATVTFGETRESRVLEFKGRYGTTPEQAFELRKDVLSLANTFGGVLVVGVNESTTQGYRRAETPSNPNVEATMQWISNTVSERVHPVPDYSFQPLVLKHDGVDAAVLAVNVRPFSDSIGGYYSQAHQEALLYPTRDDFGVRHLRADEVARIMTNARNRRIEIALNEIAEVNQRVFIASPAYTTRPEADAEYFHRLRTKCGVTSALNAGMNHPVFGREVVEAPLADDMAVFLRAIEARQLWIGFGGTNQVAVPFGIIREVWMQSSNTLGLLLDCDVLYPVGEGGAVRLRSR